MPWERTSACSGRGAPCSHLAYPYALIFEKDSTRTRTGFEVAANDQGAHVTYLGATGSQIGHKESMKDNFAPGSTGPKLEAAIGFAADTGRPASIGRLEDAARILAGVAGTRIDAVTAGLVLTP